MSPPSTPARIAQRSPHVALLGGAIACAGLVMMGGWLFKVESIVHVVPGFLMLFNTALGFFIAGIALAAAAMAPQARHVVRTVAGLFLVGLGTLVLSQYPMEMSLGIDARVLHTWLPDFDRNPWPGRMSPATCATFIAAGAVFLLTSRALAKYQVLLVRVLTVAIAGVGALAIVGHLLNFHELFEGNVLAQVSVPTALGFMALSLGLWLGWRREPWNAMRLVEGEDDRMALAGTLVLAASIAFAGLAIFGLMQVSMERVLTADLANALKSRQESIGGAIERAIQQTAGVTSRPNLRLQYSAPMSDPKDPGHRAFLQALAESLVPAEFSAFAFYDPQGRELAHAGDFVEASALRMPVTHKESKAEVVWNGKFALQTRADVTGRAGRLGEARGQKQLGELDAAMADSAGLGAISEFALCAPIEGGLHCAPSRFQSRPFNIAAKAAQRLPMRFALEGVSGVRKLTDYRGKRVLAAHAPLGSLGLGAVLKTDLAELYAPIRSRLGYLLLIMLVASAAGGWLLRARVRPLVRKLMRGEEQLRMALDNSQLVLWDWDIAAGRIYLSEQWSALLGGTPQASEMTTRDLLALVHPEDLPAVREHVTSLLRGTQSHYSTEHRVRMPSGGWKWIRSRGRVVERQADGRALRAIGTNVDISERKHQALQAAHRADHDALTGLPNRNLFQDRLERALQRSRRSRALMALMYIDVDKFKGVNDTLGHAAGDAVLKEFARRLTGCVRATDTVARLGGDEFAVVLEGFATREDGLRVANKIVVAMRPECVVAGGTVSVSASVGIAFHDGEGEIEPEALIDAADRALYEAKAAGKDGFRAAA